MRITKKVRSVEALPRHHLLPVIDHAHDRREPYLFFHGKEVLRLRGATKAKICARINNHTNSFCKQPKSRIMNRDYTIFVANNVIRNGTPQNSTVVPMVFNNGVGII
jgi:hypothetical protein